MELMLRPWRRYADFDGRSRRSELLLFNLSIVVVLGLLWAVVAVGQGTTAFGPDPLQGDVGTLGTVMLGIGSLFFAATIVPSLALSVRRLHDHGKSGWLFLVTLIPYVGSLIWLVLALWPGDAHENAYGGDPRDPDWAPAAYGQPVVLAKTTRDFPPRPETRA